jgi:hypothetical protein
MKNLAICSRLSGVVVSVLYTEYKGRVFKQ